MLTIFLIIMGVSIMYAVDFYLIVYRLKKKYKRPYKRIIQMIDKRMAKDYGRYRK